MYSPSSEHVVTRDGPSIVFWSRRLAKPIYLNDGRTVATLAHARDLMLEIPTALRGAAHWRLAADLVVAAARLGGQEPIRLAGAQMSSALRADDLA
jgi:hypothetical protein